MNVTLDHESHVYTDENGQRVPSVSEILRGAKLIDYSDTKKYTDMDYAMSRGTAVHLACALLDEDDLDYGTLDPEISGYVHAWERFRRESGFQVEQAERAVCCECPRYAGTLDRLGVMNGVDYVVDIKTGAPHPATALQLAAYQHAIGERLYHRAAVHLRADGKYTVVSYSDHRDYAVFAAACSVWWWKWEQNKQER